MMRRTKLHLYYDGGMMDFKKAEMWRKLQGEMGNYYCQVDEAERVEFRKYFETLLHEGIITVEFTKADGSVRKMICTLNEEKGAKYNHDSEQTPASAKKVNNEVRPVWDCDAGSWRSFRWDRLKKVSFTFG